jgi:peptide/nickel transport system permease protein
MNNAVDETKKSDFLRRFFSDKGAVAGIAGILLLLLPALYAPFLANGRPWLICDAAGRISSPATYFFFAPDGNEVITEKFFNYLGVMLIVFLTAQLIFAKHRKIKFTFITIAALLLMLPFICTKSRLEKTDYRTIVASSGATAWFAPIPYGPFETAGKSGEASSEEHWLGTDAVGRDIAARLIYGARVSLAVGVFSTIVALLIGIPAGLATGFIGGKFDLICMRIIEILMCFPAFLLLLILMSMLGDRHFNQSVPTVILVIGLTGWIGLALLIRGETLKNKAMPYIDGAIASGVSNSRIMFKHLLPNVVSPILISFTFGVAGAILAESGLSFLGFGVQPPTASWGESLRQAFENPLDRPLLTIAPGTALFIAVLSFNLTGEALRKAFNVKE